MDKLTSLFFIFLTILLGVYGQIVLKWQMLQAGPLPASSAEKIVFILRLLLNPWVITCIVAAFLGLLSWMAALAKADLSYAYPFTSLSFVVILILSAIFFREPVTLAKVAGMLLIMAGIVVGSIW